MTALSWATWALFTPLIVAAVLMLVGPLRRTGTLASLISVAAALFNLTAAAALFIHWLGDVEAVRDTVPWLIHGEAGKAIELGIHLDGISTSMFLVVAVVAAMVQIFSLAYMHDESPAGRGRYFTWQSLFLFSMNSLVLAPNLLQLFLGWELVGLCSYLLIGFWYKKPSAAKAALKAFWVTKFADMGLLLGLIVLFVETGGFEWSGTVFLAPTVTLLFFFAVMGKSAQFPLHVWLPDAMEGPTPVSALLHAATMVAAGVFLVVRGWPLFEQAPSTTMVMLWVGSFTAIFAAVIAVAQTDIKKVLAYSTCSQLGYMVAALGAGGQVAGYFHLTTHAFFKALLFLAAGGLIHAVHSNQLKDMGGLLKKMPITGGTFIIGSLALAGFPGFAGFFSKDLILEQLVHHEAWIPLGFLLIAAFLTAFYMGRVVFIALLGTPSEHAEHAHESGIAMTLPLIILAVPALAAGWFGGDLAAMYDGEYAFHVSPVGITATVLALSGIGLSWVMFGKRQGAQGLATAFAPVGRLASSGLVDSAMGKGYSIVLMSIGRAVGWFDRYIIDAFMNFTAYLALVAGEKLRRMQTGNVQHYVYAVAVGLLLMGAYGVLLGGG
jgi:NADH-quinone oxidoreductase subunit L